MTNAPQSTAHEQAHVRGTTGAWIAVALMFFGAVCEGFAIPMTSWPLAILGIVLGAAGIVLAKVAHLMEQFY